MKRTISLILALLLLLSSAFILISCQGSDDNDDSKENDSTQEALKTYTGKGYSFKYFGSLMTMTNTDNMLMMVGLTSGSSITVVRNSYSKDAGIEEYDFADINTPEKFEEYYEKTFTKDIENVKIEKEGTAIAFSFEAPLTTGATGYFTTKLDTSIREDMVYETMIIVAESDTDKPLAKTVMDSFISS